MAVVCSNKPSRAAEAPIEGFKAEYTSMSNNVHPRRNYHEKNFVTGASKKFLASALRPCRPMLWKCCEPEVNFCLTNPYTTSPESQWLPASCMPHQSPVAYGFLKAADLLRLENFIRQAKLGKLSPIGRSELHMPCYVGWQLTIPNNHQASRPCPASSLPGKASKRRVIGFQVKRVTDRGPWSRWWWVMAVMMVEELKSAEFMGMVLPTTWCSLGYGSVEKLRWIFTGSRERLRYMGGDLGRTGRTDPPKFEVRGGRPMYPSHQYFEKYCYRM